MTEKRKIGLSQIEVSRQVQEALARLRGAPTVELSPASLTAAQLAALIDHTALKPEATPAQVAKLCAEARQYGFASVCVNSSFVPQCVEALQGSKALVCAVVGFPLGAMLTEAKAFEARRAVELGAQEIDMVLQVGALKAGEYAWVHGDIAAVAAECHRQGAHLKVIIEAALLTDEEKVAGCLLAVDAGADFVKTSTGFGPGGATVHDVALMRGVVGPNIGVKAAGGIRSYETALAMVQAGANRLGASAGVAIVSEARR